MKIAVVGAGWYGCHIAKCLIDGKENVTLFERESSIFNGASSNNQSRLHLGFHYPRCSFTRNESITSYNTFMAKYHTFTKHVSNNLYAIDTNKSLIDWVTYRDIMMAQGVSFLDVYPEDYCLENISGAMLVGERVILQHAVKKYFSKALWQNLKTNFIVEDLTTLSPDFDFIIDCTFGSFTVPDVEHFEPCIMLLYKGQQNKAVTVMDGVHGVSLYPYCEKDTLSLTAVEHTPLGKCSTMQDARELIKYFDSDEISLQSVRKNMETTALEYMPWFLDEYTYSNYITAIRVKPKSSTDRRSTIVAGDRNIITVFPGKISGVFEAERLVFDKLYQRGVC